MSVKPIGGEPCADANSCDAASTSASVSARPLASRYFMAVTFLILLTLIHEDRDGLALVRRAGLGQLKTALERGEQHVTGRRSLSFEQEEQRARDTGRALRTVCAWIAFQARVPLRA